MQKGKSTLQVTPKEKSRKISVKFDVKTIEILEMIAIGTATSEIYNAIAHLYESRHEGLRCSMLELKDGKLLHGGAPSLPKEYCEAVHGLKYGPEVGSCGTSTYTGKRCIVENISTDPKWKNLKDIALPFGMRCCWSEPIINSEGDILGAFGMYYDYPKTPNKKEKADLISAARLTGLVMERDQNQKKIHALAYYDSLTKLPSRAHFYQHMNTLIKLSLKYSRNFSMLYIDLDDFKSINDTQGHDVGDKLLKNISLKLSNTCRKANFIARLGGDEFCIITENDVSTEWTSYLAQKCCDAISLSQKICNIHHKITCSIGVAKFPNDGAEISTLLKAADTAMYESKRQGKNRFAYYTPELTKNIEYKVYFEKSLREAISHGQISLVYQPKVNIDKHKVYCVEALARWHHPKLGQVSPTEFIKVAERIRIIDTMTQWILEAACLQAAKWKNNGIALVVAVNISPILFQSTNIIKMVRDAITKTGIDASMIELEVTENVVQTDKKNILVFDKLKEIGVGISIDDFGIGYSSFASLKHINIDCLKIDRYFITDMMNDSSSGYLVKSMIDIARYIGCDVVAEGVETREQLEKVFEFGCKNVQGFYFSKPLVASALINWISKFNKM